MTDVEREWAKTIIDGDRLALWALDSCDEFDTDMFGDELEWLRFRFGETWYVWNPDDDWDGEGVAVAMLMVKAVENSRAAAEAEIEHHVRKRVELTQAVRPAVEWMEWWLDQQECECEGIGHNCGRDGRQREYRVARAALDGR